jgi:molybdenum cofactor biosynthesis enzyme MoaA
MCHFSDPAQAKALKGILKQDELDRIAEMIYPLTMKLQIGCAAEPTVHKNFIGIIQQAKKAGVPHVALTTNANLLDEEKIDRIIDSKLDEMIISLHGTSKELYEHFMQRASFEKFRENMFLLDKRKKERKKNTPRIRVNYTVNQDNLEDLSGFYDLFDGIDVDVLQVRLIQNLGDTAYSNFNLDSKKELLEQILMDLATESKKRNTTFLRPNIGQLASSDSINDASLIYQATCRYISPKVFWEKEFDWKNESYFDHCKKIGWTKYLLGNVFKSRDKIKSYNHLLNYDVLS